MSECVVRMEMPKNNCEMAVEIKGAGDWCPIAARACDYYSTKKMPDWCPIICSLPERHGDLIDRDELLKESYPDDEYDAHVVYADDICKARTIVPANEYPEYMSQWLGEVISAEKQTNWIGEEMVEQQIDKDVSRFADGEWWKEAQE